MARSIVLRFDATCFDCGSPLSAGTTARWFGKGRVSCCGGRSASDLSPEDRRKSDGLARRVLSPEGQSDYRRRIAASSDPTDAPGSGSILSVLGAELARAVECGLNSTTLAAVAEKLPELKLCVRLHSGARFIVTARDAGHVIRCVSESMVDRVRDVMRAADGGA